MRKNILSRSIADTKKIASVLAVEVLKNMPGNSATVIALVGDLGSGKTAFAQGFARGLGIKENIISPTFVLERIYGLKNGKYRHFIHIDAYRIENPRELIGLGFKELIKNDKNILLIEWADKIKKVLPENCIKISFSHSYKYKGKNTREIEINFLCRGSELH